MAQTRSDADRLKAEHESALARARKALPALEESINLLNEGALSWSAVETLKIVASRLEVAVPMYRKDQDAGAPVGSADRQNALRQINRLAELNRVRQEPRFTMLERFAQEEMGFEVLEELGQDHLDFADVGVAGARKALERAWKAGAAAARKVVIR